MSPHPPESVFVTRTYRAWNKMRSRCNTPSDIYKWYGGRGITVCERWDSFQNFLADMGEHPGPGFSLDRIDNDGNYEPSNCRWATAKEQTRNRSSNTILEYEGLLMAQAEACERAGITRYCLRYRKNAGWPKEFWFIPPDRCRKWQRLLPVNMQRRDPRRCNHARIPLLLLNRSPHRRWSHE